MAAKDKTPETETDADRSLREALEAAGAPNTAPGPEGSILHADGVPGLDAVAGGAGGGGGVESVSAGLDPVALTPRPVERQALSSEALENRRKCVVACKLPHGLNLTPYPIVLAGSRQLGAAALGGYGITENVDAEYFAQWLKEHPDNVAVRENLIFAESTAERARDRAREQAGIRTGFEGVDPDKLPDGLEEESESKKERARAAKG